MSFRSVKDSWRFFTRFAAASPSGLAKRTGRQGSYRAPQPCLKLRQFRAMQVWFPDAANDDRITKNEPGLQETLNA
jgi:hypothetical protein